MVYWYKSVADAPQHVALSVRAAADAVRYFRQMRAAAPI